MLFSSPVFLFLFLPATLIAYTILPRSAQNALLLCASLFFYAWGETLYVGLLLIAILVNYLLGRLLISPNGEAPKRSVLAVGVALNLLMLAAFKYTGLLLDTWNGIAASVGAPTYSIGAVHLPIGISFFTFQAISYLVDVYRGAAPGQKSLLKVALYISLFPQLIAGPIVRYAAVAQQLTQRTQRPALFVSGVHRFAFGLAKKVLLANPLGTMADQLFAVPGDELTMGLAWLAAAAFTLQIYFDFSGYSDMAIGLGRMFGFRFEENFNYPYVATSIADFWRRWHISLSTWFRDYLFIPMGGSREGAYRNYRNLLLVFFFCGLWHGASWNFAFWGLYQGAFLVIERIGFRRVLERSWKPLRHVYVMVAVCVGWVFFRLENFSDAWIHVQAMFGFATGDGTVFYPAIYLSPKIVTCLAIGTLCATPLLMRIDAQWRGVGSEQRNGTSPPMSYALARALLFVALMVVSASTVMGSSSNPFIYFRF
jgi:alginate O-acetyltransferase complex protein AlgI